MTLAQRNIYFKTGIFLSSCSILLLLVLTGKLLPLLSNYCEAASGRPGGPFQNLAERFFETEPLVPFVSLFMAVFYALFVSIVVLVYFEKTQTPEILFFGLFAMSFVFEILRIIVPLKGLYELSPAMMIIGTRVLVFSRLFGTISLFISSVYAAGLDMQKQGRMVIGLIIAILVISFRLPVNGSSWDTSFTMVFAYSSMLRFTDLFFVVITAISFLIADYSRGTVDYRFIALGSLLVFLGRSLLFGADTWITPVPALIMLVTGTWLITVRLHQVYLWL
ncbi:MAG: hypothetical protein FWG07_03705 [Treponema sp.]|nr:hypothetical protein [Treponema sp.]